MRNTRQLIRRFIRGYLLEAAARLSPNETALYDWIYRRVEDKIKSGQIPDNEMSKFLALKDEIDMYAKNLLAGDEKRGSSRYVVEIEGDQVLKLAINAAGFAQNGTEAAIGMDPSFDDIINIVTGKSSIQDYNGFLWITQKKIQPLTISGSDPTWKKFVDSLRRAVQGERNIVHDNDKTGVAIPKGAAEKRKKEQQSTEYDALDNVDAEFFEKITNFIKKYKAAATGDLYKPDSWGIDNGQLKLIDYGLTPGVGSKFYKAEKITGTGGKTARDDAGRTKKGLFYAGEEQAKASMAAEKETATKNVAVTLADNIDMVENIRAPIPSMMTLMLVLKGIIVGLPMQIETFTIGNPLKPLEDHELQVAASAIRSNLGKIEKIIGQITDPKLKDKLEEDLDDILLSAGRVKKRYEM